MGKLDKNAPLPDDAAIAKEFIDAVKTVAGIMTRAKRMGLECSFSGIQPNDAGIYKGHNIMVKKVIDSDT